MVSVLRALILLLCVVVFAAPICAKEIPNWPAPATWSPHSGSRGVSVMDAITSPFPFIGVTPCRVADTRGNGFTGQYGPPSLVADALRSFTIVGQCGIPASAAAVSFNFAALNVGDTGDLRVFPAGGGVPLVSTLNYNANTPDIANAAVVALGTGGAITVQADAVAIDLIIDVNGYYAPAGAGDHNTFLGLDAGNFTMTGHSNTGIGEGALNSNTIGELNAALGREALFSNTEGSADTAIGFAALHSNTTGNSNTALGYVALYSNTTSSGNTAIGDETLVLNTGGGNTAIGAHALQLNTTGIQNIAIGYGALQNATGSNNIGINGGGGLGIGGANICIGNYGVADESHTMRIGTEGAITRTFLAGIRGATTSVQDAVPVMIDSFGQLGTVNSSMRVKQDIKDIGEASQRLMNLHPVTFRYKSQPEGRTQFGLIAEEVEKGMPELVVCSASGEPETVLYHEMPAMLLNELQRQQREIQELKLELAALRAIISQK